MFGGNGYDGGLHDAVLADSWIHDLGDVANALDSSAARVRLPDAGGPAAPGLPGVPFLPPLIRVPVPLPIRLASYAGAPALLPMVNSVDPGIPFADPIAPVPGTTKLLTAPEQQQFRMWMNSLTPGGFAGGGGPSDKELVRYKQAMENPANSEIRGLEIVTNGKDNAAYWQSMMAMSGTPGSTRYVP
ncbi:restriction endonuclease fold toxin-2 domain-containing protein [Streptomyces sp. NPDC085524]|uniref:restriction endonuclease fold toxin-2 domain-containing protein n=1 Tax=Streptomyces sp. NPDC085524 TaxID=3365728 RepID=UPI0037D1B415